MTRVLSMERVGRRYGTPPRQVVALDDVSLTVGAGEMLAVMGPSGSGKLTLLQLAGGLARTTSGRVVLCGSELGTLGRPAWRWSCAGGWDSCSRTLTCWRH